MAHIHTNPGEHDHTVTAYIVRLDTPEPLVLLHMHAKLQALMPAGGHIELNETPWQATLREVKEETGYEPEQLTILQPRNRLSFLTGSDVHPVPLVHVTHTAAAFGDHYHTDSSYLFTTYSNPVELPGEGESKDLRWFSLDDIEALGSDVMIENVREIIRFAYDLLGVWEPVPVTSLPQPKMFLR